MPRKALLMIPFLIFIALSAQISFDLNYDEINIPITGQTFAVLIAGYFLGTTYGPICLILYLLLGGLGLPIFADAAHGWPVFQKASAVFLLGFPIGAWVAGFYNKGQAPSINNALVAMQFGTAVIIICGLARLTYSFGIEKALQFGLYPFLPGAIIKIILAALVIYAVEKFTFQPNNTMSS